MHPMTISAKFSTQSNDSTFTDHQSKLRRSHPIVVWEKLRDTATIFQQAIENIKKEVLFFKENIGYVAL